MRLVRGVLVRPVAWLAAAVGRHPFRVAGLVAVLGGSAAAALSVDGGGEPTAIAAALAGFAVARPAYAAAVVAGLYVLLRPGS